MILHYLKNSILDIFTSINNAILVFLITCTVKQNERIIIKNIINNHINIK